MFTVKKSEEFPGGLRRYHLRFFEKLKEFRLAEKYSDIVIECDDKRFMCHRVVLAASCKYFEIMFNRGFKESADEKVVIRDIVNGATFDRVLSFLYASSDDEVKDLITSDTFGLFLASKALLFKELEIQCTQLYLMKTYAEFFAKLNEYRVSEKLVDVTVVCQGKSFKCHRVVLAYSLRVFQRDIQQ